ncbi:cleavage and polyadenylation specificity factor subunit 5 protein [Dioscorea alata]|uniref:Cleavage and polyadenylation specificity factor subunit 5 protein n=1 Tax=Dioscorea alata TaxID=55571 RepID=A0ACB7TV74_DIOAL|nr:cleavage and polyadenylation specificity factor subunit 5 protein [Dioscorea alata]
MEEENGGVGHGDVVDVYPLNRYYFGSKEAISKKDDDDLVDRIQRLKANYEENGLRVCVEGVLLVELFGRPHVLLLQVKNTFFRLPGGRLRHGESVEGLKRKLSNKLSPIESTTSDKWQVGECIGMWWKSSFDTLPYPYLPRNGRKPKECIKLFLVRLPISRKFFVPKRMKLLAVPLFQIHDNCQTYGPVIHGIPQMLSKFSLNMIQG